MATYVRLFSVPFLTHDWKENEQLNTELRLRILAHSRQSRGEQKSNVGGWHSETGQLEFLGDVRGVLIQQMHALTQEATTRVISETGSTSEPIQFVLQAWANISRGGDSHAPHTHPGATWSGVYYVDAGESANGESAPLELVDPCLGRTNTFLPFLLPSSVSVRPRAGLMVLFPGFLTHAVHAHKGGSARISIAFNFRKEPFP